MRAPERRHADVFLVGCRASHHAVHSGYEGFGPQAGARAFAPVRSNWSRDPWAWRLDQLVARAARRPHYSRGLLLTEVATLAHSFAHPRSLHHVIYGDLGLCLLPRAKAALRGPLVATFHEPPATLAWLGIDARVVAPLDAVVLLSRSQQPHFDGLVPADRLHVVPHGVDPDFFSPGPEPPEGATCLVVGSHLRDFATLWGALARAWAVRPDLRVVAIGTRRPGGAGSDLPDDARLTLREGVPDDALRDAYRSARLAVFAFEDATASNALLEAMACGLPVVATDVGGVSEYVAGAGVLVPPRDPDALAAAILGVLADPSVARRLAGAGRQRALDLSFPRVAGAMRALYDAVLAARSGPRRA